MTLSRWSLLATIAVCILAAVMTGVEAGSGGDEAKDRLEKLCAKAHKKGIIKKAVAELCEGYMPPPPEVPDEMKPLVAASLYGATALIVLSACALLHHVTPSRGTSVLGHVGFAAAAAAVIVLTPEEYQDTIFSPAGSVVAGVFFPVLESMRAVCSVAEDDDTRWLQYWIGQAAFMVATEWLDWLVLTVGNETMRDVWFHVSVLFLLWLQLPWTDGSTLLYDRVTKPFILPRIRGVASRVSDNSLITGAWAWAVNGSHVYGLYMVFILMPGFVEKFIVVMVGTLYPLLASVVAVTTEDTADDDTQWLVYWCVFSLFHVLTTLLDDVLEWVPGFYALALMATVWLMLPMFRGADRVFRKILVPLFGLRAELIKHDAAVLLKDIHTKLPDAKRLALAGEIAAMFGGGGGETKKKV